MSNWTFACTTCRIAFKSQTLSALVCPRCGGPVKNMGKRWRAPKKRDVKSWARVAAGDALWEHDKRRKDMPWRWVTVGGMRIGGSVRRPKRQRQLERKEGS